MKLCNKKPLRTKCTNNDLILPGVVPMERLISPPLESPECTILSNTKILGICNAKGFSGEAVLNLEFKGRELGLVGSGVALLY